MSRLNSSQLVLAAVLTVTLMGMNAVTEDLKVRGGTADTIISIPNGDFEQKEEGWTFYAGRGDCGITDRHVANGKYALQVIGDRARKGAKVTGPMVACEGPGLIELRGKVCAMSGRHLGLYVHEFDAEGELLPNWSWGELGGHDGKWQTYILQINLNEKTTHIRLFLLGYPGENETIEVYLDDLQFVRPVPRIPPWPSQYKLKPGDREKLTDADVVGPDGVVYPNWRQVGVQGGIPRIPATARLGDYGGKAGQDIASALDHACREVGAKGGGAILIGEGTFYLDRPVTIRQSGVVIRGAGRDRTRIVFRYGVVTLRAEAEYMDGRKAVAERRVTLGTEPQTVKTGPNSKAALYFLGAGIEAQERFLAEDGKRGDTILVFKDVGDFKVGEKINLHAPMTDRFCDLIRDRSPRGWNRIGYYEIRAIAGNQVTINQPLRIDFPVIDGTYARRLNPIEKSGVEDLTIEHLGSLPIDSVTFNWGWNCWARNIKVIKTGRNGIYATHSKWIEVRDCELDSAWNNDGGQAYAGFTRSADCLMENCVVKKYRHGPVVQFGAMGCVFRNSTFEGSDLQWHAGWSTENLFENCVVNSYRGHGSYGYGAYATGSGDATHGPNGPRNVVYNCDLKSDGDGVMLHGVNENWLFLHNRFVVKKGSGFTADCGSFDIIIRNNTFVLQDGISPMLRLLTPDCVGVELIGNRLYGGGGNVYQGIPKLALDKENHSYPAVGENVPPRPVAKPESIYDWQKEGS